MEISIGTGYRPYPFNVNVDTSHDGAIHSIKPLDSFDSDAGTTAEHEPPKRQRKPCRRNPTPRTVTTVPPAAGPPTGATASGARRVGAGRGVKGCASAIVGARNVLPKVACNSFTTHQHANGHMQFTSLQNHKFTGSTQRAWIPNGTGAAIAVDGGVADTACNTQAVNRQKVSMRPRSPANALPHGSCSCSHPPRVAPACPDPRSDRHPRRRVAAVRRCECLLSPRR